MIGDRKWPRQTWPSIPLPPVVSPGVSDGQGLKDAAYRLPGGRLEKQMKMIGHQAIAEEARKDTAPCPSGKAA